MINSATTAESLDQVAELYRLAADFRSQGQRIGQAFFNAARELDHVWATNLVYTMSDPFHDDKLVEAFIAKFIAEHPQGVAREDLVLNDSVIV